MVEEVDIPYMYQMETAMQFGINQVIVTLPV